MSIFGSIVSRIFGHEAAAASTQPGAQPSGTPAATPPTTAGATPKAAPGTGPAAPEMPGGAPVVTPQQPVDVEANLAALAAKNPQQLDWRRSIVDLLKLLDLDSSLASRKQSAEELHYAGDTTDSAAMNIWLHKQVMTKLAEHGGKVPDELKA